MKGEQRAEVDVGDAVRIGQAEGPPREAFRRSGDATTGRGVEPRVDALDVDLLGPGMRGTELLDHLSPVAGQEQEAAESLGGVDPGHVPENRLAADLHERLGDRVRPLLQARAAPAAEDGDRDVPDPRVSFHRRPREGS
jgi:hypothetical protein